MLELSLCDKSFTLDFFFYMQNQLINSFAYILGIPIKSLYSWAQRVRAMEMSTTLSTELVDRLTMQRATSCQRLHN